MLHARWPQESLARLAQPEEHFTGDRAKTANQIIILAKSFVHLLFSEIRDSLVLLSIDVTM